MYLRLPAARRALSARTAHKWRGGVPSRMNEANRPAHRLTLYIYIYIHTHVCVYDVYVYVYVCIYIYIYMYMYIYIYIYIYILKDCSHAVPTRSARLAEQAIRFASAARADSERLLFKQMRIYITHIHIMSYIYIYILFVCISLFLSLHIYIIYIYIYIHTYIHTYTSHPVHGTTRPCRWCDGEPAPEYY